MKRFATTFAVVMAIGLSAVAFSAAPALGASVSPAAVHHCGARQETGVGDTLRFCKGERVDGEVITLRNSDGTWGKTMYRCHTGKAPARGKVMTGVINYNSDEVATPKCSDTVASPGPRKESGQGHWLSYKAGDDVLSFVQEHGIPVGVPNNKTYFSCLTRHADQGGRLLDGVRNPSRFEMQGVKRCKDTTNWNPGIRLTSADNGTNDSLHFNAGDRIVAAAIKFDGDQDASKFNCYYRVAPSDGTLYGGVDNYWPDDDNGLPAC